MPIVLLFVLALLLGGLGFAVHVLWVVAVVMVVLWLVALVFARGRAR